MIPRLGRPLLFSVALALAACGGGGGGSVTPGGGQTPTPAPTATPAQSATGTLATSTSQSTTLTLGPIAGGYVGTTTVGAGSIAAQVSTLFALTQPSNTPTVQVMRRRPLNIGGAQIAPFAFWSLTPNVAVTFPAAPSFSLAFPSASLVPPAAESYVAYYDPTHTSNGWTVLEGPATLSSSTTLSWTGAANIPFSLSAASTYVFAAFTTSSSLPTPSPTPVPTATPKPTATPTPTATPVATATSTQSFTASTGGPVTVTFGTITGGITATLQVPTASSSGSGTATLSAGPPSGTPVVSSVNRSTQAVGGSLNPLAYVSITANQRLSFAQTPAITLTSASTSSTYAYVAEYSSAGGWTAVAGPGTLVGGKYVIDPTDNDYQIAAGQTGVFAIFGTSSLINVDPPGSPSSDDCGLGYRRAVNGHRLASRSVSHVVPNRLYVSYRGGSSAQSLARSVNAIRSVQLTPTQGVSHTVVTLAPGTDRDQAAATLRAQSGVVGVSPLHTRSLLSDSAANDPLLDNVDQWYLYRTSTDPAGWALSHGTGIVVAVIDTGIDMTNTDLAPKLNKAESIIGGMITTSAQDTNGHGSNVAGLVGATTNNDYGYASVGWDVHLLDYKIFPDANAFSDCQGADTGDEAEAIDDAVANGASVVSMSLGAPNDNGQGADPAEEDAVEAAISAGVTVVAAAGNEYDGSGDGLLPDYPAAYPGVIAAGASAVQDSQANSYASITSEGPASYSNSGATLLAPGGDATSDNDNDILHWIEGYSTTSAGLPADRCSDSGGVCSVLFNGTSQATPQVAATAALMMAYHGGSRSLTPAQVKTILSQNTDVLPGVTSDRQGAGRLDVAKAVAAAHP